MVKIVKNPGNGRLNNLNNPVLMVLSSLRLAGSWCWNGLGLLWRRDRKSVNKQNTEIDFEEKVRENEIRKNLPYFHFRNLPPLIAASVV